MGEADSFVYVGDNKYTDRPSPQSRSHGIVVGDKVLTAQETHLYDTVMSIVEQKNELKRMLMSHNQQIQMRVQYMKRCKDEYDLKVQTLENENHSKNKQIKRLEEELNLLNQTSDTMESYKSQIIKILEKMTYLVQRPTQSIDEQEKKELTEIVQDLTHKEDNDYVIVSAGHKSIHVINERLRKLDSFKSMEAQEIRQSIQDIQKIYQQYENQSGTGSEKKVSLKEFVDLKTNHDEMVTEMNLLRQVKDENQFLAQKLESLSKEKEILQKKLHYTEERLRSLDNESFEIKPNTDTKRVEDEREKLKNELESKSRMIQQLQTDLQETEECFKKSDQHNQTLEEKNAELKQEYEKLLTNNNQMKEKLFARDKEMKQLRRRENKDASKIDELQGICNQLKKENDRLKKDGLDESLVFVGNQMASVSFEEVDSQKKNFGPVPRPRQDRSFSSLEGSFEITPSSESTSPTSINEIAHVKELEASIQSLTDKNESLQCQILDLQQKLTSLDEINVNLQKELTQISNASDLDLKELSNELTHKQKMVETMMREKEDFESQRIQFQESEKNYQTQLKSLVRRKDEYYERLKSTVGLKDQNEKLGNENQDLRGFLQSSMQKIEDTTKKLSDAQNVIVALESENSALCREIKGNNAKITQLSEDIQAHQMQATIYQSDFKAERDAREKQEGELSRLRQELEKSVTQIERYKNEVRKAGQQQFENIRNRHLGHGSVVNTAGPTYGTTNSGFNKANQNFAQGQSRPAYPNYDQHGASLNVPYSTKNSCALLPCPICNENFPDVRTLDIHLMDCMND